MASVSARRCVLDQARDDVHAFFEKLMRPIEHRVGLAAPGYRAQIDRQRAVPDAQTVAERRRVRVAHAGVPVQHTARGIDHEQIAVERVRQNPICQRSARYDDDPEARARSSEALCRGRSGAK